MSRNAQSSTSMGAIWIFKKMMLVPTYIAPSAIEGVGVFAAEAIAAGTLIWQLDPNFDRLIPQADLDSAPAHFREFVERYTYPYPDNPALVVLEVDNGRFMNHNTLMPNTDFTVPTRGVALRDIAKDEELTCNYSEFDPEFELLPARLFTSVPSLSRMPPQPRGGALSRP